MMTAAPGRRIACDADLIPAVLNTVGIALDLGRTHRLITASLRTALTERDRGCCFPGCDRPAGWTQAPQRYKYHRRQ
jgi:hypothetical protein